MQFPSSRVENAQRLGPSPNYGTDGGMETVLLADNARLSRQLVDVQTKLDLNDAVASEKIQHLESTIQALTRQSTNDAFTSAKRVAELERQVEALKTGVGGGDSAPVSQAPGAAAPGGGDSAAAAVEAKYAQLLSSLQDEWEREKGRLQRVLNAEKDRANEAVLKAAAERKRLTDALSERISTLTKQVSGDVTGLGKRCDRAPNTLATDCSRNCCEGQCLLLAASPWAIPVPPGV